MHVSAPVSCIVFVSLKKKWLPDSQIVSNLKIADIRDLRTNVLVHQLWKTAINSDPWRTSLHFRISSSIIVISQQAMSLIFCQSRTSPQDTSDTLRGGDFDAALLLNAQGVPSLLPSALLNAACMSVPAEGCLPLLPNKNPPNSHSCNLRNDRVNMFRTLGLLVGCLLFLLTPGAGAKPIRQRVYYVGIIESAWDYAPSGKNLLNGKEISEDE